MQADRYDFGSPKDWLRRAKSNLFRAKQPKHEEVFWEDLCFDAQQAAEKSLKALRLYPLFLYDFCPRFTDRLTPANERFNHLAV